MDTLEKLLNHVEAKVIEAREYDCHAVHDPFRGFGEVIPYEVLVALIERVLCEGYGFSWTDVRDVKTYKIYW